MRMVLVISKGGLETISGGNFGVETLRSFRHTVTMFWEVKWDGALSML